MKLTIEELNNKLKNGYNLVYHKGKDGVKSIKVTKPVIGNTGPNVIKITKDITVKLPIWLENTKTKGTITVERILNAKDAPNVVIIHNVCCTNAILLGWIVNQLTSTIGKDKVSILRTSPFETSYKFMDNIAEGSLVLYVGQYIYIKDNTTDKFNRTQNLLSLLSNRDIDYETVNSSIHSNSEVRTLNRFFGKVGIKYSTTELANIVYGFNTIGNREWPRKKTDIYLVDVFDYFRIITVKEFEKIWKVLDLDKQVGKIVSDVQGTTPDLYKDVPRGNCVWKTTTMAKVLMQIVKKTKHDKVVQLDTYAGHLDDVICCEEVLKKLGKCLLIKFTTNGPYITSKAVEYHLYVSKEYSSKAVLEDIMKLVTDLVSAGETVTVHKAKSNGD